MERLTEAQYAAIKFATYGRTGDGHYCEPDNDTRLSTLNALVRKGYLSDAAAPYRFWLTDKGEALRNHLHYEACATCGAETHHDEAACIHCGSMKQWAQ